MRIRAPVFSLLALLASATMVASVLVVPAAAQTKSTINLVAVDAVTDGNTKTSLGPRDTCVRTEQGSKVTVDVIVDSVPQDRPAIELNRDVMARFRPQMRAFYYNPARYRTYLEQLGITYPTERAADGSCTAGATP